MTHANQKRRVTPFALVMPQKVREHLERHAALYRRPLTQEILLRLEQSIAVDQKAAQQ